MSLKNFLLGLAANFITGGIIGYLKGPNAFLISIGIGFVLLIVAYTISKKQEVPPAPPAIPSVHQENKQEFNPQFNPQQNFYFGSHDPLAQLKLKLEEMVIGYMKRTHPATGYEYDEVALALQLEMRDARDALERLETKRRVWSTGLLEAKGGKAYFLDDVERKDNPKK